MNDSGFETRALSSLSKVFADSELNDPPYRRTSALRREIVAFQTAYRTRERQRDMRVEAKAPEGLSVSVYSVGLVPSEFPIYPDHDGHILRSTPGLYPDPLYPLDPENRVHSPGNQWRSVWLEVQVTERAEPGIHAIEVIFYSQHGDELGGERFEVDVIPASLPKQQLIRTEWFHCDGLAQFYGVEVFSEEHWRLIERYVETAAEHGINMLLTPLFTPPLDTAVGGERLTVQLVDVEKSGDGYAFGFDKLERWIKMGLRLGIEYFEFSHLFTQWGAAHAPKIMVREDGETKRLFGWDTDALGAEYREFLTRFLKELVQLIRVLGIEDRIFFHVSDEPHLEHLETYRKAAEMMDEAVGDYPRIDALSDYAFYKEGLVPNPIPATDKLQPFLESGVAPLWTYYCCSQYKQVANRFFTFPSERNRILGLQLYKYRIKGFLHWGFNFWNSQYSKRPVNPYLTTDADIGYPSGDAFLVYPGEDGPVCSLRIKVFREALQDLRALELLEQTIGRDEVLNMIEGALEAPLSFEQYPRDAGWLLDIRSTLNEQIKASMMER
ncbi:DUF4091 domain-containing protein [Paenibacillus ihbetae]|uniref:Glycoside hydrolase 123 catalytic domain-containing protein n=1 Tax=Paenibacillus ihbetae TaxID=1870820 RepID=A0ABX3K0E2_9BACL|nr:DUF4091 domain-containing protein [Paenibacillus ihbetae]OOC62881.1 hypothetical protein BBD40_14000 [Paenibacillus ihbetae]